MAIAFQGYSYLLGPEQLFLESGARVTTPVLYRAWHAVSIKERGALAWDSPEVARARVNHGRWLADCPWCKGGMLTKPDWRVAYCAGCGARFDNGHVVFPDAHAEIERLLCRRVRREQQNWDNRQTVTELARENSLQEVVTP